MCVYVATCPSTRSQKKTCLPRVPVSLVHSFIFALLLNNFCVTKYTYRRKKIFDVNGEFYTIRFSFLLLNCTDFLFIELYRPVGFFSYCLLTFESHQLCNSHFGGLFGISGWSRCYCVYFTARFILLIGIFQQHCLFLLVFRINFDSNCGNFALVPASLFLMGSHFTLRCYKGITKLLSFQCGIRLRNYVWDEQHCH